MVTGLTYDICEQRCVLSIDIFHSSTYTFMALRLCHPIGVTLECIEAHSMRLLKPSRLLLLNGNESLLGWVYVLCAGFANFSPSTTSDNCVWKPRPPLSL